MFHFNTITRVTYYDHDVKGDGIDHCYDCRAEILILKNFLVAINRLDQLSAGTRAEQQLISWMSYEISQNCSLTGRMLSMPPPKPFGKYAAHKEMTDIYDSGKIKVDHSTVKAKNKEMIHDSAAKSFQL